MCRSIVINKITTAFRMRKENEIVIRYSTVDPKSNICLEKLVDSNPHVRSSVCKIKYINKDIQARKC